MIKSIRLWAGISFVLNFHAYNFAQNIYFYDSIPVQIENKKLSFPWSSGINSAQPSRVDLDGDKNPEWVIFERTSGKFTVLGRPELESKLPLARSWALWADVNGDSKTDLLVDIQGGIAAYSLDDGKLELQSTQLLSTLFSGTSTPLEIDLTDYPALWDIDGDGDLDFFNFVPSVGTTMEFHRNLWKESGRWAFTKETNFWGEFVECASCGDFFFGKAAGCRTEATLHSGSATTLMKWFDNELPVMLISDSGCSEVYLMSGEKNQKSEFIFKDFALMPADTSPNLVSMPTAFVLGDTLLFSPTLLTNEGNLSDFANSLWMYVRQGNQYSLKTRNFLQNEMIDLGEMSQAAFADVDLDGDLDMIATNRGKMYKNKFRSTLHLFENQGGVLTLKDSDWLKLSDSSFTDVRISFLGKKMVFGARVAASNRKGFYQVVDLQKIEPLSLPCDVLDEPNLDDIDADGDLDLLVAKFNGSLQLFENQNNKYVLKNPAACGLSPSFTRLNLSVSIVGNDMLLISNNGKLQIINNFRDSLNLPTFPQTLLNHHFGRNNSLAVWGDLIFVGTAAGGFNCLKFKDLKPIAQPFEIVIYPNPTPDFFKISAPAAFEIEVFDAQGKKILAQKASPQTQISVDSWKKGIYIVKIFIFNRVEVRKLFVRN